MSAPRPQAPIEATVKVETEKDGIILVEAVADEARMGDGRPVAGWFVRRRYHGERFLLEKPEEFSARWMRFVDVPPKDWVEALTQTRKRIGPDGRPMKDQEGKVVLYTILPEGDVVEDYILAPELDQRDPRNRREDNSPFSMADLARRSKEAVELDYNTGKPRKTQ